MDKVPETTDVAGYVSYVSPKKTSRMNNSYFDVQMQTSETLSAKIRIMESPTVKRSLFLEHNESKSPVKLSGISCTNAGPDFFNTNTGSRLHDVEMLPFCCKQPQPILIINLQNDHQQGNFSIAGQLKWLHDARTGDLINHVQEYLACKVTNVVTVSFNGLKLSTIAASTFTLTSKVFDISMQSIQSSDAKYTLCCPDIISVKIHPYLVCVNFDCKKKVTPYPGDATVSWKSCKRRMLIKKCKQSYSCEITLQKKDEKQITLTIFPDVVNNFCGVTDVNLVEDALLVLEDVHFTFTQRKVVTKMFPHDECAELSAATNEKETISEATGNFPIDEQGKDEQETTETSSVCSKEFATGEPSKDKEETADKIPECSGKLTTNEFDNKYEETLTTNTS
eukprot:gene13286-14661_t